MGFDFEVVAAIIGFGGGFDDMRSCAHDEEVEVGFGCKGEVGGFCVERGVHSEVLVAFEGEDKEACGDVVRLIKVVERVWRKLGDVGELKARVGNCCLGTKTNLDTGEKLKAWRS